MPDNEAKIVEALHDPDWFVEGYDAASNSLSFVRVDRAMLARQAFLDYRWRREGLERCEWSLDALTGQLPQDGAPPPDLNFIWHTSYCCSTLLAKAVDVPGRCLSLREPMVLVAVAEAKRVAQFGAPPLPARLIDLVFRLLGRTRATGEQALVKPSNFANTLAADAARSSRGKTVFLYSGIESFLISIAKGGDRLGKYVRRLFSNLARDDGKPPPWPVHEILLMSDLEIAALCWHMQIEQFQRSASLFEAGRWATLDCDAFLSDPAGTLAALATFFRLDLSQQEAHEIADGPVLRRHAKQPAYAFDADRRRAQSDEVRRRLGSDLQRVVEWSERVFPNSAAHSALFDVSLARAKELAGTV